MKRWIVAAALALVSAGPVHGQVEDIRDYPGYVNLEWICVPEKAEKVVDVTIGPRLLRIVHEEESRRGTPATQDAGRILSLQIKSFEVDTASAERMRPALAKFERELVADHWRPVVRVKRPDQLTNVSVKYGSDRKLDGYFIMTMTPGAEASFVNIVGDMQPERLKQMFVNMDQSVLDSLLKSMEEQRKAMERLKGVIEERKKPKTGEAF
jgi:hypothetical protein